MTLIGHKEECPACGQTVAVNTSGEGTSYYLQVDKEALSIAAADLATLPFYHSLLLDYHPFTVDAVVDGLITRALARLRFVP